MSASPEESVADLFDRFETKTRARASRDARIESFFKDHVAVAQQHAELTFLRITSSADFVDGSVSDADLDARFRAAYDDLVAGAAEARARRGMADSVTALLAEPRLMHGFFKRFAQVALARQRGCA